MTPGPGIWITGPSRSGTSMLAGVLAQHGVFFGRCKPGDEHNEKGYWEHPELVDRVECGIMAGWPDAWWGVMEAEGYDGTGPWALKRGPAAWPWIRPLFPALIIACKRPVSQIARSRARRWPRRQDARRAVFLAERRVREIEREAACPVLAVNTWRMVKGDYRQIAAALERLDLEFSPELADGWIDRSLWNRGPKRRGAA